MYLTPNGLLIKAGKKDRMIWDGSFLPFWWSVCINMMQDPSKSPSIKFGKAFTNHLIRIWNLRITHPYEDILLWDYDVSGTYRLPKYNTAVFGAFVFTLINYFFYLLLVPLAQTLVHKNMNLFLKLEPSL